MGDHPGMDDAFIAVVVLVSVLALVVAVVALATSGGSYDQIGRGGLEEAPERRETYADVIAEVRADLEARNARRVARGQEPLDVDAEVSRRLREM
jgi:hypothetical protein